MHYRQDDSASEDGSEPPSPREAVSPKAHAALDNATARGEMTSLEAGKEAVEEEDPMVR